MKIRPGMIRKRAVLAIPWLLILVAGPLLLFAGDDVSSPAAAVALTLLFAAAVSSGFLAARLRAAEEERGRVAAVNARLGQELTKLRQAEEEAREEIAQLYQHNQNILESLKTAVLSVDPGQIATTFNAEAARITGLARGAVIGKPLGEVLALRPIYFLLRRAVEEGLVYGRGEVTIETPRGKSIPIGISTSILIGPEHEPCGAVAIFKDLSEIKNLERKLKRSEHLALLGEMAASLAHEIRNPLNSISGFAQLLQEKARESDRDRRYTDIIVRETRRIERIVSDTLVFSKETAAGVCELELNGLITACIQTLSEVARKSTVSFNLGLASRLPPVTGNASRLEQVFTNLMLNAIQAMPDGGVVSVTATATNGCVEIEVSDTGPGIRQEIQDKIFLPFFTTKSDGTGLGLAICSRIIEDHGGSIEVSSAPGQGTTFKISLPGQSARTEDATQPTAAAAAGSIGGGME
jgi:PAS domain S-box-containing protein